MQPLLCSILIDMKQPQFVTLKLEKIVGGGQAIGTLEDGRKCFVWGGLPGETVTVRITKKKSRFVEGVVAKVLAPSPERIEPRDPDSYLSTSPWQIMSFDAEQRHKAALIKEAFELHKLALPNPIEVFTDRREFQYRNKVEFSWYSDTVSLEPPHPQDDLGQSRAVPTDDSGKKTTDDARDTLDLAFFRRGSKGKIVVNGTSLAHPEINTLARTIRDLLRTKPVSARNLKTLLIRSDKQGNCVWQLYLKDELLDLVTPDEAAALPAQGGEIIYSDPKSPASRVTKRLTAFGDTTLADTILGVPFRYACEGFFQVNVPVYEQALRDMKEWVNGSSFESSHSQNNPERSGAVLMNDDNTEAANKQGTLDLYSGVGTIGLTIGGSHVTLVESNEHAVNEMKRNIAQLGRENTARAVLAPSEKALGYITSDQLVIVDPPRAGLHADVIAKLLEAAPPRIIYLSCNPVTQARDAALLAAKYFIRAHRGYNFFPRTPHIEHLVVLDRKM